MAGAGILLPCVLIGRAGLKVWEDSVFPNPDTVPLSEFHRYGSRLNLRLRVDEKLLLDRDGMNAVFAGMAWDTKGNLAFHDFVLKEAPDQSGIKAFLHEEARGRHYFAIGRDPKRAKSFLMRFTEKRRQHDPLESSLLSTDEGVLPIKMPGASTKQIVKRFGPAVVSVGGHPNSAHSWQLRGLSLTLDGFDPAGDGSYMVDLHRLSDWQGSLNSALKRNHYPLLPTPIGSLTLGEDSVRVKQALGLSEKDGSERFCPAMLPQIGKSSIYCRLSWDASNRLDEVQFSSQPFEPEGVQ